MRTLHTLATLLSSSSTCDWLLWSKLLFRCVSHFISASSSFLNEVYMVILSNFVLVWFSSFFPFIYIIYLDLRVIPKKSTAAIHFFSSNLVHILLIVIILLKVIYKISFYSLILLHCFFIEFNSHSFNCYFFICLDKFFGLIFLLSIFFFNIKLVRHWASELKSKISQFIILELGFRIFIKVCLVFNVIKLTELIKSNHLNDPSLEFHILF